MYKTGEKPGSGSYACSKCGQQVKLNAESDALPPCPDCANVTFNSGSGTSNRSSSSSTSSKSNNKYK